MVNGRRNVLALVLLSLGFAPCRPSSAAPPSKEPVDVGGTLQLFLDDYLIESITNLELKLHSPVPAEVVLRKDRPWEDTTLYDPVVIKDGPRYRMWYRANFNAPPFYTGYAESRDGIHWSKPSLGLIAFKGSRENNLVWSSGTDTRKGCVLSIFKDTNPNASEDERYKAIAVGPKCKTLLALVSPEGFRWRLLRADPILRDPKEKSPFDSHNITFWDAARGRYVVYLRGWPQGWPKGIRSVCRSTSTDFRTWSAPEFLHLGNSTPEHLYKNAATPYYRRPDVLLMFPKRFLEKRKADPNWSHTGLSDIVFMSSRDGLHWDRRFMEAFIRPGPDPLNWHESALEVGQGLVPTPDGRMSLYYIQNYRTDSVRICRGTLRVDGLVSVHAHYAGGEFLTRPIVFQGERLVINYATSAAGSLRVEIQDVRGKVLPGFAMSDCREIYGDHLDRVVTWRGASCIARLSGEVVRLRIEMKDADLYCLQFQADRLRRD